MLAKGVERNIAANAMANTFLEFFNIIIPSFFDNFIEDIYES